ncbi:MAG: nitrilase-related carbon-nitrogen hydrolase, partial [Thermoleophilaceae bacterium]
MGASAWARSTLQIDWSVNEREEGQVRAAAVQLQSTDDKDRNLGDADRLTRAAAADGAELVVLPERL